MTGDVATIAPGVTIGDRAVIGPKAMVYNDVERARTMLNMNNEEALAIISQTAMMPSFLRWYPRDLWLPFRLQVVTDSAIS